MTPQLSYADPTVIQRNFSPQTYSQLHGRPFRGYVQKRYNMRRNNGPSEDMKENRPYPYNYAKLPEPSTYVDPVMPSSESPPKTPTSSEKSDDPLDLLENDTSKLKGILWPGMSIFDSATPTARRRRNQRKDASILEQLEANSQEVEATEIVWTPDWHFKKEKRISGMVDNSSSPWKSSPVEKPRKALVEVDISLPYFRGSQLPWYDTYTDQRAEMSLMYDDFPRTGRNGSKRKRGVEVWQDEEDRSRGDEHRGNSIVFSKPTELNFLTRGFGYDEENNNRLRQTTELNNVIGSRLPEDPFVTNVTRGEDSKPPTAAVASSHFNPFIFSRVVSHDQASPSVADASTDNTSYGITETSVHGFSLPNGNGTGVGCCYGDWLQSHPQHQTQQIYAHDHTHTRSAPWAIAYAQLDPPLASLPTFTNGFSTSSHSPTFEHQRRTNQDFQGLFATQGLWGYDTYNPSPEPYFDPSHNAVTALMSPIKDDGELPIRHIDSQHDVGARHAALRDIEGMTALNDAAELSAFADATESPIKVEGSFSNVVPSALVHTTEVTTTTEYDEDSVDEGRTITAPGTPV